MEGSADLRIVMLGKTGAGKSSTGNSILGKNVFPTSWAANSNTANCLAETHTVDGRSITVIDTPGYFSTDCSDDELKPEIAKCIIECAPGPHAFLIVLPVRRQTAEERKVVEEILEMFGDNCLKHAIVLFTHGKQLSGKPVKEFVEGSKHLKELVQKCGDRLHVIDNTEWDDKNNSVQIKKLLNTIDQVVKENGGKHYTNELLQAMEQAIKKEEKNVVDGTKGLLSKTAVRERAKQNVMERLLVLVAGVATGGLLGALLGAPGSVLLVLRVKEAFSPLRLSMLTGVRVAAGAGGIVGAIAGGKIGAEVAQEAETVTEAVSKTAGAVKDEALRLAMEFKKFKVG